MRHTLLRLLIVTAVLLLPGILPLLETPPLYAGGDTVEDQVADLLIAEAAKGKIKVVIFDFSVSSETAEKKPSESELKQAGARFTEEFTANVMKKIRDAGKRDTIAVIDPAGMEDLLREKKLSASDVTGRTAVEIGRSAGMDEVVTGRASVSGNAVTAAIKVVRVKDGEILGIVRQDRQEKPAARASALITLIDTVEKIKIGEWKALPLNLASHGTLSVTISVVHGNPIDAYVIPGPELENFKQRKEFKKIADFTVTKSKTSKHSADLGSGDYYLVLRDNSLGVFSAQNSEIKITVQLGP